MIINFEELLSIPLDKLAQVFNEVDIDIIPCAFQEFPMSDMDMYISELPNDTQNEIRAIHSEMERRGMSEDDKMGARMYLVDMVNEFMNMGLIVLEDDGKKVLDQDDINALVGFVPSSDVGKGGSPGGSDDDGLGLDQNELDMLFGISGAAKDAPQEDSVSLGQDELNALLGL